MSGEPIEQTYLVVQHKIKDAAKRELVPNGMSILDEEALVTIISANPDVKLVKKAIKPGCTSFDIFKIDLVPEENKEDFAKKLEEEKARGNIEVPWKEFLVHSWEGHKFSEVIILVGKEYVKGLMER